MISGRRLLMVLFCTAALSSGSLSWAADSSRGIQEASAQTAAVNNQRASQWFAKYDQIRRQAQMTPAERAQADKLMSKGMSTILGASSDSAAARQLLSKLVNRYDRAKTAMSQLPLIPETEKLHRGYYQYFSTARDLFSGYLAIQGNLFAKDESGQPIISQLLDRKARLEALNTFIQDLDQKYRSQYRIAPYKYSNG